MRTKRSTKETEVAVDLERDGGKVKVSLPHAMARHMLETLARYAGWGLSLEAKSLDEVDHHVVEDAALALGDAVRQVAETGPIARYGHAVVPMDDALVEATVDVGGRAFYAGRLPDGLLDHAMRSFAFEAGMTLHLDVRRGEDAHHVTEAAFKALGRALREALAPSDEVRSTKGEVSYRR